jgi:hypothetical protein
MSEQKKDEVTPEDRAQLLAVHEYFDSEMTTAALDEMYRFYSERVPGATRTTFFRDLVVCAIGNYAAESRMPAAVIIDQIRAWALKMMPARNEFELRGKTW